MKTTSTLPELSLLPPVLPDSVVTEGVVDSDPEPSVEHDPEIWVWGGPTSTNCAPLTVVTLLSIPWNVHWTFVSADEMCEILSTSAVAITY